MFVDTDITHMTQHKVTDLEMIHLDLPEEVMELECADGEAQREHHPASVFVCLVGWLVDWLFVCIYTFS